MTITQAPQRQTKDVNTPLALLAILYISIIGPAVFIGQTSVWAYLYQISLHGGVGEQPVATGLSVSNFSGIMGAMLVTVIRLSFGRTAPAVIAIGGSIGSLFLLLGHFTALMFEAAIGPALAAFLVKQDDYSTILWLGIALYAATLIMLLPLLLHLRRHGEQ